MNIEKMSDEVIHRYGYEAKKTIFFFRIVEKGSYEKRIEAQQKVMK